MKLLFILLSLFLTLPSFAGEKRVFPERGITTFGGLDDSASPPISNDARAADIQNIMLDNTGHIQKRYGYSYEIMLDTNDVADSFEAVTGLHELVKSDGTRTNITNCGTKVWSWDTDTKTNITGGITSTEGQDYQWSWITALDYAIGTNGLDPPIKTDGNSATLLSFTGLSSSVTKAKCVIWWKNYLILGNTTEGGTARPTRIRASNIGKIETWSDDDYWDIATLGGQSIEGFATIHDNLYIFLTDSIYMVSLVGGDELFNISKVSEGIGCIAKNSIKSVSMGNTEGLIFLSRDKTINYLDGVKVAEISSLIDGVMDDLSTSRLQYAVAADDRSRGHYFICVTDGIDSVDNTVNNLLLDYNYATGEWSKQTQIDANAICIANDTNSEPQVYFGNYKSFIYQMNNTTYDNDVDGLTGTISAVYGREKTDTTTASGLDVLYDTNLSNYTVLLMHNDGVNGSTTFVDKAKYTVTTYGDAQIDTDYYKFGTASGLFDGTGDYVSIPDSDDWAFGSGDFTIDFWVRFNSVSNTQIIYSQYTDINNKVQLYFSPPSTLKFQTIVSGSAVIDCQKSWTPVINTWYHVAMVRSSNTFRMFVDGTQIGTDYTSASSVPDYTNLLVLGKLGIEDLYFFNGWLEEIRVSKGVAKYTSAFTPSTSAYTNSDLISAAVGATIRITSGTGVNEERVICSTTASGVVVTNSTTATGSSVYSVGDIDAYYITKWLDMGNSSLRKNFEDVYIWAETKDNETMSVSYATDENTDITNKDVDLYGGNTFGGTSIVGTSTWAGLQTNFCRIPLNVSGRYLKIKFAEADIDKTMNLYGYGATYTPLDVY